ncbi:hypothetical protein BaRGS_00030353, partial [Batillaria attramentaria]
MGGGLLWSIWCLRLDFRPIYQNNFPPTLLCQYTPRDSDKRFIFYSLLTSQSCFPSSPLALRRFGIVSAQPSSVSVEDCDWLLTDDAGKERKKE